MSLKKGKSKKVIGSNIEELLHKFRETEIIGTSHPELFEMAQNKQSPLPTRKQRRKNNFNSFPVTLFSVHEEKSFLQAKFLRCELR